MVILTKSEERAFSDIAFGKLSRGREYGQTLYGQGVYGEETLTLPFGKEDVAVLSGIFHRNRKKGEIVFEILNYYYPKNPQTELQQANRNKITSAVLAWQGLTSEEKVVYNKLAKGKNRSGYNLFCKEYMLSH